MNPDTSSTLTITRTFAASRVRLFDAWTNPNSITGWWGPKDFTLLLNERDLKPGGRWRMGMTRQGEKAVSGGVYREITPPARLVMTHAWEDVDGHLEPPETLVTITLAERDDQTEMVFVQTGFDDAPTRDGHRGGWNEAFDALAGALARATTTAGHDHEN
ncbi:MAG: SRPBCC domain-containing protein [Chitinophagaceae bacterium]|nr:SRPBCC domain-containing protein [Rubrivivax sp.]